MGKDAMRMKWNGLIFVCLAALVALAGCMMPQAPQRDDATIERLIADLVAESPKAAEPPPNATLDDYLAYAERNNPGLRAARERWLAALERVTQADTLPDPSLVYRLVFGPGQTPSHEIDLTQTVPWFGKLDFAAAMASDEAEGMRKQYEAARLALVYRVKTAWYEYYYLARSLAVTEENRDLLKYLEEVARARYRAATATHQDVIRAQIELGRLEDDVRSLSDLRGPAAARLNAALGRPPGAPVATPAKPDTPKLGATDEQVLAWTRQANPELLAMNREIGKDIVGVELAKKNYYPDFMVGGGFMRQFEMTSAIVSFGITLPVWLEKYRAAEREAAANLRAAVFARQERENAISYDVKTALYGLRDAGRKIVLYRDTLEPKAREHLKANESAFSGAKSDFLDVVDAERTLLEFQLAIERALADYAIRLAELEMLTGRRLTEGK